MEINTDVHAQRVTAAQARQLKHNQGDHSECKPTTCFWTAERQRKEEPELGNVAAKLVHDLGLSNHAESRIFIEQFLELQKDNEILGLLIVQLQSEVSALKAEILELKRRKGIPLKAETR